MRDQTGAFNRYPLSGIRSRFLSQPLHLRAAFVHGLGGLPTQPSGLLFEREEDVLVLGENKRLKRAQNPMFVDGFELACHNTFIVQVGKRLRTTKVSGLI